MSAFCPHDAFIHPTNLRIRMVPEWGCVLVYTPSHPNLHYLDAHSWLIFELCEGGASFEEIRATFHECVPTDTPPEQADRAIERVLTTLLDNHVVTRVDVNQLSRSAR